MPKIRLPASGHRALLNIDKMDLSNSNQPKQKGCKGKWATPWFIRFFVCTESIQKPSLQLCSASLPLNQPIEKRLHFNSLPINPFIFSYCYYNKQLLQTTIQQKGTKVRGQHPGLLCSLFALNQYRNPHFNCAMPPYH